VLEIDEEQRGSRSAISTVLSSMLLSSGDCRKLRSKTPDEQLTPKYKIRSSGMVLFASSITNTIRSYCPRATMNKLPPENHLLF